MAKEKAVIDPVVRIEGHMRVECEVEDGKVTNAWVSGTLFRGMEEILKKRKAEDAFYIAQRICGVCPISHGHASTQAAEAALGIKIPQNARIIRNIIEGAQYLHSHILWFYTLAALDYVNVISALSADIADTYALAAEAGTGTADFGAIQSRLLKFAEGKQLSIFSGHWWTHPAYKLSPELNLIAVAHYLEALEMQAEAATVIGVMGGKFPHFMTSLPGGTAFVPTEEKLDDVLFRITKVKEFIDTKMIPDTIAVAANYLDALEYGVGVKNFLSWGVFEDKSFDPKKRAMPRGAIYDAQLSGVVDADPAKVIEYTERSWYDSPSALNPAKGETAMAYTDYDIEKKYSWAKAPRHDGRAMEVGPLARMLVAFVSGVPEVRTEVDGALERLGAPKQYAKLISLLGRIAARNLEAKIIAQWTLQWVLDLVEALKGGDSSFFTQERGQTGEGAGLWEAPRGAVGHWMNAKDGAIENYQVVSPSTWLSSPRDADDRRGPIEEALIGCPVEKIEEPLEPLRIVHSFDP